MKILGFETSCDDTAVAIVEDGTRVLASTRQSQVEHSPYGGVVPEIAARLHAERWPDVMAKCLQDAKCTIDDIGCLAVTEGPGLQTALLNGTTAASFLALTYNKPLIPVHHIFGHVCSTLLERSTDEFQFSGLVLTVSGGHTDFYLWHGFTKVEKIGQTIDDAAGEAFDKVAKMLNLGYPGGPIVSQWAEKGDGMKYDLPRPLLEKDSLDFSFSGVKAAIYRLVEKCDDPSDETFIADVCASFEQCVVDIFLEKISRALRANPEIKMVHFVGGVSANKRLRQEIEALCGEWDKKFFTTKSFEYSTDNAAMIAGAAYFLVQENSEIATIKFIDAHPRLNIQTSH